jgi:hypothetical protein
VTSQTRACRTVRDPFVAAASRERGAAEEGGPEAVAVANRSETWERRRDEKD